MFIKEIDTEYHVEMKHDPAKINYLQKIPGAYFNGKLKAWIVPVRQKSSIISFCKRFGVNEIEGSRIPASVLMLEKTGEIPPMPELNIELSLKLDPYPFQKQAVAYNRKHINTLNGDKMGLGKSIETIATICSYGYEGNHLDLGPGLIICPSTLKYNWQAEWLKVAGIRSIIMKDSIKDTWPQFHKKGMCDVFICNYESLPKYFLHPDFKKRDKEVELKVGNIPMMVDTAMFKWFIIDESHYCKDPSTIRTKATIALTFGKKHVYCLSGTSVVNGPIDLASQLMICNQLHNIVAHIPQKLKNGLPADPTGYFRFKERYCKAEVDPKTKKLLYPNMSELEYRMKNICFFTREKHEVLPDLPPKTRRKIICEIDNREIYNLAKYKFARYLKEFKDCDDKEVKRKLRGAFMVQMGELKRVAAAGKIQTVKEHIDNVMAEGDKYVLFLHHKEMFDALRNIYPNALTVMGDDTLFQRHKAVERFQNNPDDLLILVSDACGAEGLTLTASSRMGLLELPWTFAKAEQEEDRCHRINTKDNVTCDYFVGLNTIDEYVYEDIIMFKKDLAQMATGGTDVSFEEVIDKLLTLFKNDAI